MLNRHKMASAYELLELKEYGRILSWNNRVEGFVIHVVTRRKLDMYIVQVADLHVGSMEKTSRDELDIINASINKIKSMVPTNEEILICVCGDNIDSKKLDTSDLNETKSRYKKAAEYLRIYFTELENLYKINMKFCAGNHDITHIDEFVECMSQLDKDLTKDKLLNGYSYFCQEANTYFLFLNSCYENQYEVGRIDFANLERLLGNLPYDANKILVLHHTIMSMDDEDKSSIRNAARLLGIIDNNNISGVLHGHIHGRDILTIGRKECKIIGTGALFSRGNADVNSQFNIINYHKGIFLDVNNCRFIADERNLEACWEVLNIGNINCQTFFKEQNFELIYKLLMDELDAIAPLYNVVLQIAADYEEFKNNLKQFLQNENIEIGTKKYNYFKLAEMWEDTKVPTDLYFNHGQYFLVDGRHGIEEIAEQLKNRPTSNRAILTTCDMQTVKKSFDHQTQKILPSLLSIQFSKDNTGNILYVHMHLRALEANRFLKINICEIYNLLEQLKRLGIQFQYVNITISAFRVQKREKFNCFIRADIDTVEEAEIPTMVALGEIDEICRMLEEKRNATETIANSKGIQSLCKAMKSSNKHRGRKYYNEDIIKDIETILDRYVALEDIHKRKSIHSNEEKEHEKEIEIRLGKLIEKLKILEGENDDAKGINKTSKKL